MTAHLQRPPPIGPSTPSGSSARIARGLGTPTAAPAGEMASDTTTSTSARDVATVSTRSTWTGSTASPSATRAHGRSRMPDQPAVKTAALREWLLLGLRATSDSFITDDIVNSWIVDHPDVDVSYHHAFVAIAVTLALLRREGWVGGDRLGWYGIADAERERNDLQARVTQLQRELNHERGVIAGVPVGGSLSESKVAAYPSLDAWAASGEPEPCALASGPGCPESGVSRDHEEV